MARAAESSVVLCARRDLRGASGHGWWIERPRRGSRLGRKLRAGTQLEDEQPGHVANWSTYFGEDARGQRPDAAPTSEHRDVLVAPGRVGDGSGNAPRLHVARPEFRAARSVVRHESLGGVALKHESAGGRQHTAVPRTLQRHAPALLLSDGIPGNECSLN